METKISTLKQEFEKLANNSSVFERGLIISSFSFNIPEEVQNFLDEIYDHINEFSIFLVLPFSGDEYVSFSVFRNLKEPLTKEKLTERIEIKKIDKQHPHLMFTDPSKAFISILFLVSPLPINFSEKLEKCKKHIAYYEILLDNVAWSRLIIKDFELSFGYYEKLL
jgi:hypothetical protein